MPHTDSHAPGSFCWAELATTDQNDAKNFYGGLFAWAIEDSPIGPERVYTKFLLDGRDAAAAYNLTSEMKQMAVRPNWMPYITVGSADEVAAAIQQNGGSLQGPPFDVMTFGRMAVAKDPTGAHFAIWEPREHSGFGIEDEDGTLCWADLISPDPDKATAFYHAVFGWTYSKSEHDPSGYLHIQNGEMFIGGVPGATGVAEGLHPHWLLYFQTPNVDEGTSKVREEGGNIEMPPANVPGAGRFSIVTDKQGAVFALWQPAL